MGQEKLLSDEELYHHGILGQKWGFRRYQNADGTLTPEGRERMLARARKYESKANVTIGESRSAKLKRAKLNQEVIDDISEFFPDLVFKTIIPRNTRLAEAPSHGLPINYYDKSSKGSKSFEMLAQEVIDRG